MGQGKDWMDGRGMRVGIEEGRGKGGEEKSRTHGHGCF